MLVLLSADQNFYYAVSALLTFWFAAFLTGCQQLSLSDREQTSWHLNARKEGNTVQFCLSTDSTCLQQDGISPGDISVYRYDSMAENEIVWETSPESPITNQSIDGIVTYGIPPKNWRNKITPPALVCGKAYLFNPGANFFALQCDGTVVVFDFQHLESFFSRSTLAPPAKKRTGPPGSSE